MGNLSHDPFWDQPPRDEDIPYPDDDVLPPRRPASPVYAKAAEIAARVEGATTSPFSDGWWRMPCPAHGGDGQSLGIRDALNGIEACCHSHGCDYWDILEALQNATGLQIYSSHRRNGNGRNGNGHRPPKLKTPTQPSQSEKDKERLDKCNSMRAVGERGPFAADHPGMRYLLTKEQHPCWNVDMPLPIDYVSSDRLPANMSWLTGNGFFEGAAGCLLGSFREAPGGGTPSGIAMVWIDNQGMPVNRTKGANKLSLGKQYGLIWMDDQNTECSGVLFVCEGLVDAVRVRYLLMDHTECRVACTVGSMSTLRKKLESSNMLLQVLDRFALVVLIPDGDEPGRDGARDARKALRLSGLRQKAKCIWVSEGGDPAAVDGDWLRDAMLEYCQMAITPEPIDDPHGTSTCIQCGKQTDRLRYVADAGGGWCLSCIENGGKV